MKHLFIKAINNPQRAWSALIRRMRVFFKKFYFWLIFRLNLMPRFHCVSEDLVLPEAFKFRDNEVIMQAYNALNTYGDFLGVTINDQSPPWNEDVRLRDTHNTMRFFSNAWYSTIKITTHQGLDLGPDIKVPWMLGRLNHLSLWAYAYYHTKDALFLDAIIHHLHDFFEKNPPYYGVQWVCTMEVALRAINLILTYQLLESSSKHINDAIIHSLNYHWWFIKNHWEIYDRKTNNHYLSNLVSYWWLCNFFKSNSMQTQKEWCAIQLCTEVEKQLLPDSSFYEGSSAYHRLSTDLVALALAIDSDNLLHSIDGKYKSVEEIDELFEYDQNQRVLIGDNDSSPVLHPVLLKLLRPKIKKKEGVFILKNFGLDILKQNDLHVTLRHHVYDARQPSGHFHEDCNAFTLAINKIACIVDPGTYLYTSSVSWRNKFRNASIHATCSSKLRTPMSDCFALPIHEKIYTGNSYKFDDIVTMNSICDCRKFLHERTMQVNMNQKEIGISDFISCHNQDDISWHLPFRGNILSVGNDSIDIETDGIRWQIKLQKKWCISKEFYAPSYGKLEPINSISIKLDGIQTNLLTKIHWH